ncbi:MAG TPA: carbohydrate binding domain-containing protein, partial [Planctomycetota bacterium]|nr:carbohydrate binding domain-containing protein [Planctomycetota bacterium]
MLPWVALALTQGSLLANGDFEAKPAKDAPIAGWTVDVGARNAGNEPLSELVLDKVDKHGGKQSLRLAGNDKTRAWQIVKQEVAVRPGAKCTLRAWAKADKVRPEKVDGTIPQFQNGYVALLLLDRGDEIVSKGYAHVKRPTSSWTELTVELDAPATARRARVMLFLSMSGKLWIDDVKLEVAGGTDAPKPSLVFSEGFENATAVPPEWKEEEGAMNGAREPRSTIAIDASVGAPGSPRSLRLEGDGSTRLWYALRRAFPAQPGDVVALAARARRSSRPPP